MLSSRLGPTYSKHLHYPMRIGFEVARYCKKDPLNPHEKMFKAYKFSETDVHYHWIFLFFFLCFACVLVIAYLVSFSYLHLASCLNRSLYPAVPIHTSKLCVCLLETKHAKHIMAASHFPIAKSVSLLL